MKPNFLSDWSDHAMFRRTLDFYLDPGVCIIKSRKLVLQFWSFGAAAEQE